MNYIHQKQFLITIHGIIICTQGGARGDGGIRRGDPNKFDSLCDGVLGTLALVHSALQEVCMSVVVVCVNVTLFSCLVK